MAAGGAPAACAVSSGTDLRRHSRAPHRAHDAAVSGDPVPVGVRRLVAVRVGISRLRRTPGGLPAARPYRLAPGLVADPLPAGVARPAPRRTPDLTRAGPRAAQPACNSCPRGARA